MFRSFLIIILLGFSCSVSGQTLSQIQARYDTALARITRDITIKSASRSITPQNVGGNMDSLANIGKDAAALSASAGNLDAVLTLGNTSAHYIDLTAAPYSTYHYPQYVATYTGATLETIIGDIGGTPTIAIKSPTTSFKTSITAAGVTANRVNTLPDEGIAGLPVTFVTHRTKNPTTVYNATDTVTIDGSEIIAKDNAGNSLTLDKTDVICVDGVTGNQSFLLSTNGAYGYLQLYDIGNGVYAQIQPDFPLTGNYTFKTPNATGVGLIRDDSISGSGDDPVFVTKTYGDANYGNASITTNILIADTGVIAITAIDTLIQVTSASGGSHRYNVGAVLNQTAGGVTVTAVTVDWTNEGGVTQTYDINTWNGVALVPTPPLDIWCNPSTTIRVRTRKVSGTTFTINAAATLIKIK